MGPLPPPPPHAVSARTAIMLTVLLRTRFFMDFSLPSGFPYMLEIRLILHLFRFWNRLSCRAFPLILKDTKPEVTLSNPLSQVQQKIWSEIAAMGQRLGETIPDTCTAEEFDRSARLWLLKFAKMVSEVPFVAHPVDDHPWSSMGVKGLSFDRIVAETANSDAIPSDMHGIVVLLQKGDLSVMVPIASDLDEDAAEVFGNLVRERILDFVDVAGFLDFAEGTDALASEEEPRPFDLSVDPRAASQSDVQQGSAADEDVPLLEAEIENSLIIGPWKEIVDISRSASYPLEIGMLLRQPSAWDIARGLASGLPAQDFPEFTQKAFSAAFYRSMRHDASAMKANKQMLDLLLQKKPVVASVEGQRWFSDVYDLLQSFGKPAAQPGICVALAVARQSAAYDFEIPEGFEMDEDLLVWSTDGVEIIALGVGLNPVQAVVLSELARGKPEAFLDLEEAPGQRWIPLEPMVFPNALISRYGVTMRGRNPEAYEKVRQATLSV